MAALTATGLSEMAVGFLSLFGGFPKKIAPPDVPELWTSFAAVAAACAFISVKITMTVAGPGSIAAEYLLPAVIVFAVATVALCLLHVLTRNLRTYKYPPGGQERIAGTEYRPEVQEFVRQHPGENVPENFGGDPDRIWTDVSLRRSRRLLGIGYALSVACLAFTINLGIEALSAPKDPPKFADLVEKLADVHFDLDKADLVQDARDKVTADAAIMLAALKSFPHASFLLEGFCDDRGAPEHNLSLAYQRAEATREALILAGVPGDKLQVASHGKNSPLCSDDTEECRQKNRRVHVTAFE